MTKITIAKWNKAANNYLSSQEESGYALINRKIVIEHFKNMHSKKILDLGCGYGWYTNYFSSIGADIIGCDGSEKMIEIAKKKYPQCNFDCCDIEKRLPYENEHFDLIFCNQTLMDVEKLEEIFEETFRILKNDGRFYFSIVHPAFYDGDWVKNDNGFSYGKVISQYLSDYNVDNDFWGKTTHYHRPISKYLNVAIEKGFQLIHLDEPITYDGITKTTELPLFLFCEFEKRKRYP